MSGMRVYQWDTESSNISLTKDTVAEWDGFHWYNAPMYFSYSLLAPDGKIYSTPWGPYLHFIEYPDLPGAACHVVQHALVLPRPIAALPNLPNFRLGTVMGIQENNNNTLFTIRAVPNPANNQIVFEIDISNNQKPMQFEVYDHTGNLVSIEYYAPFQSIINYNVSELESGFDYGLLNDKDSVVGKKMFVVAH